MRQTLSFLVIFGMVFVLSTAACCVVWEEFVDGYLYDCTDPMMGYLWPDGWVGAEGHWPVAVVKKVVGDRSMSEPDEIKKGWSVAGLWGVWIALFASSLLVSLLSALALSRARLTDYRRRS